MPIAWNGSNTFFTSDIDTINLAATGLTAMGAVGLTAAQCATLGGRSVGDAAGTCMLTICSNRGTNDVGKYVPVPAGSPWMDAPAGFALTATAADCLAAGGAPK